ncbi:hypothetical protein [Pseudoalteromonas sp. BDTF-M6]|uniref:hypothetical protein n=1 Tax=Pseudoalteromonas sp. BDTF-M6 TaxID=2796132 RepID=UPI001BAE5B50|nr:hypothetical protein [Pseudoalteromonas sp. BDTF-M6]MBS3796347.1 hypothetical protein [Pseudoalteromonas sp. BDTF-M6]
MTISTLTSRLMCLLLMVPMLAVAGQALVIDSVELSGSDNGDGSHALVWRLTVSNQGEQQYTAISLTPHLSAAIPEPATSIDIGTLAPGARTEFSWSFQAFLPAEILKHEPLFIGVTFSAADGSTHSVSQVLEPWRAQP